MTKRRRHSLQMSVAAPSLSADVSGGAVGVYIDTVGRGVRCIDIEPAYPAREMGGRAVLLKIY